MFKKFSLADYDWRAVIYFVILLSLLLFNYFLGDYSVIVGFFIFKLMFYIIYHLIFLYLKRLKSLDDSLIITLDKLDRFSRFDDFEVKTQTKSFDNQLDEDDLDSDGGELSSFLLKYGFINTVLSFPIYLHLSLLFVFLPMSNSISFSENHFRLIVISLSFLFELVALFVYHCFFKRFRN